MSARIFKRTEKIHAQLGIDFEYYFVNDGSTDQKLQVLRQMAAKNEDVHYLSLSRNFGKEAAMLAGLEDSSGDFVTILDSDLQDPLEILLEMFEKSKLKMCTVSQPKGRIVLAKLSSFSFVHGCFINSSTK